MPGPDGVDFSKDRGRTQRGGLQRTQPPLLGRWPEPEVGSRLPYIWTAEVWLFVAAVLDLYSRRIVGWSMQVRRDKVLGLVCPPTAVQVVLSV